MAPLSNAPPVCSTKFVTLSRPTRLLLLSQDVQTISSPHSRVWRYRTISRTIVVEPSPGLGAWLLITQSNCFSNVHVYFSKLRCSKLALRAFQQFTRLFETLHSVKGLCYISVNPCTWASYPISYVSLTIITKEENLPHILRW